MFFDAWRTQLRLANLGLYSKLTMSQRLTVGSAHQHGK